MTRYLDVQDDGHTRRKGKMILILKSFVSSAVVHSLLHGTNYSGTAHLFFSFSAGCLLQVVLLLPNVVVAERK